MTYSTLFLLRNHVGSIRFCHVGNARSWQVSSCGRVRTTRGEVSFGSLRSDGYRDVFIGRRLLLVHRLVAGAFLGIPPSLNHWQVNHIDGNRSNNFLQNLKYVTPAENMSHSFALGRRAFCKPVMWRRITERHWTKCESISQTARMLGVSASSVSRCCRGLLRQAAGFEFKFACKDTVGHSVSHVADPSGEQWKQAYHPKTGETISNTMVSTFGRIRRAGRTSLGTQTPSGYYVTYAKAGVLLVHRLVAATFLGHPSSPDLQVNHIDGNRSNNCCSNLEYVTPSENILKAYSRRLEGKRGRTGGGKPIFGRRSGDFS